MFWSPQVFLLVNESTVKRYKSGLADEIEPAITQLIERAEQGLASLEKKEMSLQAKVVSWRSERRKGTYVDGGLKGRICQGKICSGYRN